MTLTPLSRLQIPLILLILAFVAADAIGDFDHQYSAILGLSPYALLLAALGLAHYFNRSRHFAAAVSLLLSFWIIQRYLQSPLDQMFTFYWYSALSVLLPGALLLLLLIPERGLWNRYGLLALAAPVVAMIAGTLMAPADPTATGFTPSSTFLARYFAIRPYAEVVLSVYGMVWGGICLLIGLVLLIYRNSETESALIGCLACVTTTLMWFYQPLISTWMYCAAALMLIISLLRSSFEMAYRDELTGLLSRRALNEKLRGLGRSYSIAMLDVDHFKNFNDTYGHDVGDDVLKIVAKHINRVGGGGTAYRYGGEEFCIVFPNKSLTVCKPQLELVRAMIADHRITLRDKQTRPKTTKEGRRQRKITTSRNTKTGSVAVTISIGCAERDPNTSKPEQVLQAADKALYKAKRAGRNCLAC